MKKILFILMFLFLLFSSSISIKALDSMNYEELFSNHQTVMLVIHPETGMIHDANKAAVEFYGYSYEVLISMSINDINQLSQEEITYEMEQAVLEERNFFIFKHQLANNEIRTVHVYSYPTEIEGGTFLFSIIIDQTGQALADEKVRIYMSVILTLLIGLIIYITVLFVKVKRRNQTIIESSKIISEQERMKTTLLSNLPGVTYRGLHDEHWTMLFVSEQIKELTGYDVDAFYKKNISFQDLIHPDDSDPVRQSFQNALIKGNNVKITYRIITRDNITKWVIDSAQFIGQKDENGYEIIEGFIEDITLEKLSDTQAEYYKDLLQYIITSSNQGIAVHDKDMNYIYVSDKYKEHYHIENLDIIGKNHYEVFPNLPEKWREVHKRTLKGEVISKDRDSYERSDGTVDYAKWLSRPWYDENGEIGGLIIYTEIINELIKAELDAKKTRDDLQLIMDNLPIGIAVNTVLPEVKFEYMNDFFPEIYGTTREKLQVPGAFWNEVYEDPTFREKVKQISLEGIASNDLKKMKWEDVPITKNGKVVKYITAQAVPIPKTNFIVTMVIDVTDQKRKENEIIYTSNHDYLTSLPNRRYFEEMLLKLDHFEYYPLSITMIDVDGLKIINDAFGHEKGNEVLIMVSNFLKKNKRENDFIARVGGDEFIILRPNTSLEETQELKVAMIGESQMLFIDDLKTSLSMGYSVKTNEFEDTQNTLKEAEDNMYRNKVLHGQSARNESVMAIFNALQDKYQEERIHSNKVSELCKLMGQKLGLTSDETRELELAGLMHDIGKITIPDNILDKPGKLNDEEWKIMKNHTVNGYNILRSADKYSRLAEYALTHHERFDGKGYPNGLKGKDIPLFSRIISICDSYEAMTADRPYRKALGSDYAIEELKRCKNSQFDGELVDAFVEMHNQMK